MALSLPLFHCAGGNLFADDPPGYDSDVKIMNELLGSAFDAYVDEDYERSVLNFQRVLQMNPNDKTAQKGLKQSERMLNAKKEYRARSEEDNLKRARKLARKKRWLDAMDLLASVLQLAPNNRQALELQNGLAAQFREKMSDPKTPPGNDLVFQGMIHYLNKRYDEAIAIWKESAKIRPEDFKIVIYIERAEQVLKLNEKYELMVLGSQRAKAQFASGHYEEAAKIWQKILEHSPDNEEAKNGLARAQEMLGKSNRAALIGDHYDNGLELFNRNLFADSLKEWNSILELDPQNEVAKEYVAKIREKGIKVESKTPADLKISTAAPSDPPAPSESNKGMAQKHYTQGSLKYAEGNVEEALKEWREALRLDPNHAATLKALGKVSGGKK